MISDELLSILQCPQTQQPLRRAEGRLIAELNSQVDKQQLTNRIGQKLETKLDGGLVREDGQVLFPIIDGIPILLIDEAILLGQSGS